MRQMYVFAVRFLIGIALLLSMATLVEAQWAKVADFPDFTKVWSQVVYLNGRLYCFGGKDVNTGTGEESVSTKSYELNVLSGSTVWNSLPDLPTPRMGGYAAAINGKVYLLAGAHTEDGGITYTMIDSVLEYDPAFKVYSRKAPIPTPRYQVAGAVIGSKIYIMTGINGSGNRMNTVEIYDVETNNWTSGTGSPLTSSYSTATSLHDSLYIMSGSIGSGASAYVKTAYKGVVNNNAIAWSPIASLPVAVTHAASGTANGNIYLCAGATSKGNQDAMYQYDPATNSWTSVAALPVQTYDVNTMPGNGTSLYYIGGRDNTGTYRYSNGIAQPVARITPPSLDFLMKPSAQTVKPITVSNEGNAILQVQVQVTTSTPWLTLDNTTASLQPGTSTQVGIRVNTSAMIEGNYNGEVRVTTNDPNKSTISIPISLAISNSIVQRRPILEMFSSSTSDSSRIANAELKNVLTQINDRNAYTVLQYPQDIPGSGDPYCTDETVGRRVFYGSSSIPQLVIDGNRNSEPLQLTPAVFTQYADALSFVKIEATHSIIGKKVSVQTTITPMKDISAGNLRLMVAVCEKKTTKNGGTGSTTEFNDVVKKLLPNPNGTPIGPLVSNTPLTLSTEYIFPGNYRLPTDGQPANRINTTTEHSVEDFSNLEVIVWIQDLTSSEVLNSSWSNQAVSNVPNVRNLRVEHPVVFRITPTPTRNSMRLTLTIPTADKVRIDVYDVSCSHVRTVLNEFVPLGDFELVHDFGDLPSGIYNVILTTSAGSVLQRIVIQR